MTKFVLISDTTLAYEYRNFPLLDFLPCAPIKAVPPSVYKFLKGPAPPALPDGQAVFSQYSIRKLEAALLRKYRREDVAVAHEDYLSNFIKDDTEITGRAITDPLGLGRTT